MNDKDIIQLYLNRDQRALSVTAKKYGKYCTSTIDIWTKRYDDTFNKIAITEDHNRFNVTVLLKPETKKKIIDHLNDNCKIMMDINIELVSASYVSTKLKCRGEFIKSNTDNLENNFELSGKDSMCFWGGNIIYSEKDVTVRMKS